MTIPTEPIGSIPRPLWLIEAIGNRDLPEEELEQLFDEAVRDTVARFEETGSPVVTDGEQRKFHNFWTYPVERAPNTEQGGFTIPFEAGHERRMRRLSRGPFRYHLRADTFLRSTMQHASVPVKQAVISASAMSLMYPQEELPGYSRDVFIHDLINEHVSEVKACLALGAHCVQIDFTEARFALKLDDSGALLESFVDLNNMALDRFTLEERRRLGVHTCPGGDRDSTHSADVDYAHLIPLLFSLRVKNFYIALACEPDRERVLALVRENLRPGQRVFAGVISPIDPRVETPEEVMERTLQAARYIPVDRLGTTDDCGFSPFYDDTSTSRDIAFAKIRARVQGTALAARELGLT